MADKKYQSIVVGGGIAGLTCAAYLAREGQKVLLVEKNEKCGGLVDSFTRDGFHFDAGVRALENAGVIFPMMEDLGIQLEMVRSPVSLGIEDEVIHIESLKDLAEYRDLLVSFYPESEADIDEMIRSIRKIMKHMDVLYGIENPLFKDIRSDRGFIFRKLLPWLPRFMFTVGKINRMSMPVEDYLETIVRNASLRDIVSQHFFRNTPAFFAMSYFSLYLDYFYPRGGIGSLAEAVEEKVYELGGSIRKETRIVEVDPGRHLLKDDMGLTYRYDNLIWAADLKSLYDILDTSGLSPGVISGIRDADNRMRKSRGGDSVYTLFLEVDEPVESFGKITRGQLFYTPSRQGLGKTHTEDLDSLLADFDEMKKEDILSWLDRFTRLNTYEISIPGLKYPDLAPPGKTGLIISFLAEYDLFARILKAGWYEEFRSETDDRILDVISGSIFPMLKDKIIRRFSFSPLDIEKRVGSSEGAITGWSFGRPLPVEHKIQFSHRSVLTPIPSVFKAGQWVYSPAGVPMSILTGKLAADKVIEKNK